MTWLNTSVHSGFARSASEAMFPRLFPDAGWWCPSLNPAMGGTRLWDLSRGNWGTLTNMANDDWVVSGGKSALNIQANQSVNCGLAPQANFTNAFSVSVWLNLPTLLSDVGIISKLGSNPYPGWGLTVFGGTGILSGYWANAGRVSSLTAYPTDRWFNVVLTFSGSTAAIYRDGSLNNSASTTVQPNASGHTLWIGRYDFTADRSMKGDIDDARMWNRALSATEVRQLWQIGRGNMPLRRRRRYTEQAAGGNRRRRVLLGAEC